MSEENVERVRRGFAAFSEGGSEAILPLLDPEIEWHTPDEDLQAIEPYRGIDGVRRFFGLWEDEMEETEIEVEEIFDGGDCVLAFTTTRATGKVSGLRIEIQDAYLVTHDDNGIATTMRNFLDRDKALEAARLEE